MTSIVIQFVRLVAPFTRLEKVVNYNRKVQATKFINNEASINGVHQLNDEIKNILAEVLIPKSATQVQSVIFEETTGETVQKNSKKF